MNRNPVLSDVNLIAEYRRPIVTLMGLVENQDYEQDFTHAMAESLNDHEVPGSIVLQKVHFDATESACASDLLLSAEMCLRSADVLIAWVESTVLTAAVAEEFFRLYLGRLNHYHATTEETRGKITLLFLTPEASKAFEEEKLLGFARMVRDFLASKEVPEEFPRIRSASLPSVRMAAVFATMHLPFLVEEALKKSRAELKAA